MQTKAFTPTYPTNNDFIEIITDLINTSPRFRIEGTYRTYGYEILVTEDFNTEEEMLEFMNEVHNKVSASYNFCTTEEVERHISLFWYDYHDVLQKLIGYLRSPQKRQKAFWTNDFRMMKLMKMRCEYLSGGLIKYFNDKTALQITEPKIQIHCRADNPYTEGANTVGVNIALSFDELRDGEMRNHDVWEQQFYLALKNIVWGTFSNQK